MATYKIPSLLPTIKAAKITARNDAYTNPQLILDKSYEEFNKGIQDAIKSGVMIMKNNAQYRAEEKKAQERLQLEDMQWRVGAYEEVQGLKELGEHKFDRNKDNYFYALKDRYLEIKKRMLENPDLAQRGAKALAEINDQLTQYRDAVVPVTNDIVDIKNALKLDKGAVGSISFTSPVAEQELLLAIAGYSGFNVGLVNRNGKLVLYMPPQTITENGVTKETNGAQLDLEKYTAMSESGNDFIQFVPEWREETEDALKNIILTPDGKTNRAYLDFEEVVMGNPADNKYQKVLRWQPEMYEPNPNDPNGPWIAVNVPETLTINETDEVVDNPWYNPKEPNTPLTGEVAAKQDLIKWSAFDSITSPEHGTDNFIEIIWDNVIGTDSDGNPGQDEAWNPQLHPEQLSIARKFFANKGVEIYGHKEEVTGYLTKEPEEVDTFVSEESNYLFENIDNAISTLAGASEYFKNQKIDGKRILSVEMPPDEENWELSPDPQMLKLWYASGSKKDFMEFDLTSDVEINSLVKLLVKEDYGDNKEAREIRKRLRDMLIRSRGNRNKKKKKETDNKKPLPIKKR